MKQLLASDIIVPHRADVQKLGLQPKPLRDQLIIDLAKRMGLRSGEIAILRWEYIDFDEAMLYVMDSKRYHLYPLPLDW